MENLKEKIDLINCDEIEMPEHNLDILLGMPLYQLNIEWRKVTGKTVVAFMKEKKIKQIAKLLEKDPHIRLREVSDRARLGYVPKTIHKMMKEARIFNEQKKDHSYHDRGIGNACGRCTA